jgi:hypothetical protein
MMGTQGIGGYFPTPGYQPNAAQTQSQGQASSSGTDPTQSFLAYMKETPAQKLEDAWLAKHHLTRQQLAQMSPEKREVIEKQMAADLKGQIKEATAKKTATKIGVPIA